MPNTGVALGLVTAHTASAALSRYLAADPTGLSSPIAKLALIAGLAAFLVLLILQWRRRR